MCSKEPDLFGRRRTLRAPSFDHRVGRAARPPPRAPAPAGPKKCSPRRRRACSACSGAARLGRGEAAGQGHAAGQGEAAGRGDAAGQGEDAGQGDAAGQGDEVMELAGGWPRSLSPPLSASSHPPRESTSQRRKRPRGLAHVLGARARSPGLRISGKGETSQRRQRPGLQNKHSKESETKKKKKKKNRTEQKFLLPVAEAGWPSPGGAGRRGRWDGG